MLCYASCTGFATISATYASTIHKSHCLSAARSAFHLKCVNSCLFQANYNMQVVEMIVRPTYECCVVLCCIMLGYINYVYHYVMLSYYAYTDFIWSQTCADEHMHRRIGSPGKIHDICYRCFFAISLSLSIYIYMYCLLKTMTPTDSRPSAT